MRTAQQGDSVRVHYVKRLEGGSTASSRGGAPLEMTVGVRHPRLPGLGLALVGLAPGASVTVRVPPELAYGAAKPSRVRRWARGRFPEGHPLPVGQWAPALDREGRRRSVRVLEVRGNTVVVDTNHGLAGQELELEVELVEIHSAGVAPPRAIAFDVDPDSLTSLRQALSGWEVEAMDRVTDGSLGRGWTPPVADLLVIGADVGTGAAFALCRGLRGQAGSSVTRILVLLGPGQEGLVPSALAAGADSCLILPVEGKNLAGAVPPARAGNPPGRHAGRPDRPQDEDMWRDAGGEG
jgi:peptidylprolyl isomerase